MTAVPRWSPAGVQGRRRRREAMARTIPITLDPPLAIEIDGAFVARGLALAPAEFRRLMEHRKITVLCERGVGEDEGLFRASFYHEGRRVRLVVDGQGRRVA